MKAFQLAEPGQVGQLVDIGCPEPKPNEVLIEIAACGLNFADLLMETGEYQEMPEYPFTLGMEMSGLIVKIGANVDGLWVGDRVAVFAGSGGLAEYGCFLASSCIKIPDQIPFRVAASFQIAYGTSHLALHHRARIQKSDTVLVLGAAGGVGLAAIEIAKLFGSTVIAVARGANKRRIIMSAGADHVLNSETDDICTEVRALGGADIVYDPVGGEIFNEALRACNPEARIIIIGFASGTFPKIPANIILVKNITIIGFYWGGYLDFNPKVHRESISILFQLFEEGKLDPHISHVLPLERTASAMDILRNRKSTGKVVVTPRPALLAAEKPAG